MAHPTLTIISHIFISPGYNYFGHHAQPAGEHPIFEVDQIECVAGQGIRGDRFFGFKPDYKGQITFFSLDVFESLRHALNLPHVQPAATRRNVMVRVISGRAGEDYSTLRCPVLLDLEPDLGPMEGIERGLHATGSPRLLVLAVDFPHMTTAFLRKLVARSDALTGAVPKLNGELEPLAAIYPRRCHVLAFNAIAHCRQAARDFALACLHEHAVRTLTVAKADTNCFNNWNTPADVGAPIP